MRRRVRPDDPAAHDLWWADDPAQCVRHYWVWRGRRWLADPNLTALPAVARMDAAREMCLRRHGLDPLTASVGQGRPAGRDDEGRVIGR